MSDSYENIERPYGDHLERTPDTLVTNSEQTLGAGTTIDGAGTFNSTGGGSVAEPAVTSEASMDDVWIKNVIRSLNWKPKSKGFYIDGATGYAEFSNVFITGSLGVEEGATIAGWTVGAEEFYSGNVKLQSVAERILMGAATSPTSGIGVFLGKDGSLYKFRVGDPNGSYMSYDGVGTVEMNGGVITEPAEGSSFSVLGWQFDGVFTATNSVTATWSAGTLSLSSGTTYAISAGNTSIMTGITYIYFDLAAPTVLSITPTAATAVGENKILVGVAKNNTDSGKTCTYQIFGGAGGVSTFITADQIAANTITANEILSNTITANEIDVDDLFAQSITATGTITGARLRTSSGSSRVQLNNSTNSLEAYRSGDLRVRLDDDSLRFYNINSDELGYISTPDPANFYIGATSGSYLILNAEGTAYSINFNVGGDLRVIIANNSISMRPGGTEIMILTPNDINLYNDVSLNNNDLTGVRSITLEPRSSTKTSLTSPGMIFNSTNGGDRFIGRPGGGSWKGSIDMTAI